MSNQPKHNQPDWSEIFARYPELEAPGYQEALQNVRDKKNRAETERIKALMQGIQKEKTSYRNKVKNRKK